MSKNKQPYRNTKKSRDNKNLQNTRNQLESKKFREHLNKKIEVWTLDNPDKESSWLLVELHFKNKMSANALESLLNERLRDILEG